MARPVGGGPGALGRLSTMYPLSFYMNRAGPLDQHQQHCTAARSPSLLSVWSLACTGCIVAGVHDLSGHPCRGLLKPAGLTANFRLNARVKKPSFRLTARACGVPATSLPLNQNQRPAPQTRDGLFASRG